MGEAIEGGAPRPLRAELCKHALRERRWRDAAAVEGTRHVGGVHGDQGLEDADDYDDEPAERHLRNTLSNY